MAVFDELITLCGRPIGFMIVVSRTSLDHSQFHHSCFFEIGPTERRLKKLNLMRSEPRERICEPRKRIFEPRERIFEPPERIFEPRERIFEPRKRRIETRFPCVVWLLDKTQRTVEPRFLIWGAIYEIATPKPRSNQEFQNATDLTCRWFYTSNQYCIINSEETLVKAVMNELIERACTNYHEEAQTDLVAIHEVNRPSARSHLKSQFRQKHRDHEPSSVRVKRLVGLLSKRKSREHSKNIMKNCFPKSSEIHRISKNYKDFRINFLRRCDCFFTAYFINMNRQCWAHSNRKVTGSHALGRMRMINNYCNDRSDSKKICQISNISHPTVTQQSNPVTASNCNKNARYNESKKRIMLSGDIELNPGPMPVDLLNENSACFSPLQMLETKLLDHGLIPVEVGGEGNCFFHVISHQLFNDPIHHFYIRAAGVDHLRQNPERFIESNLDQSWLEYLENMSRQGTWADNLIIQAVADALNLKIIIIESDPKFAAFNTIEATNPQQECIAVYIGHIGEVHYMSTKNVFQTKLYNKQEKTQTMK